MESFNREYSYSSASIDTASRTIIRNTKLKAIFAIIQLTIGVCTTLPLLAIYVYYKDTFNLDISTYTFFKAMPTIAFCLKPVFGFSLDTL